MLENFISTNINIVYSSLRILISLFFGALLGIYIGPAIISYLFGASVLNSTVFFCSLSFGLLVTSSIYNILPLLLCEIMPLRYLPQDLLEERLKDCCEIHTVETHPNNINIVKTVVGTNGSALRYASNNLKNNIDVVKLAVAQDGWTLQYAGEVPRNDIEVVKLAVEKYGWTLRYASNNLKNNIEVVKLAVAQYGFALEYASEDLRNNIDIIKLAVAQDWHALQYAGEAPRNNIDVVKLAVAEDWHALQYAGEAPRNDIDVVKLALAQDWHALQYAGEVPRNDIDVVKIAVAQCGSALQCVPEVLRQNKEVVSIGLLKNKAAIKYVPGYGGIATSDILPSAIGYLKTVSASCFFKVKNPIFKNYMQLLCSNLIMKSRQRYVKSYLDASTHIVSYLNPIDAAALAGVSKSVNCMDVRNPATSAIAVDKASCPELPSLNSILSLISKN